MEGVPEGAAAGVGAVALQQGDARLAQGIGDLLFLQRALLDDGNGGDVHLPFQVRGLEDVAVVGEGDGVVGMGVGNRAGLGGGVDGPVEDGVAGGGRGLVLAIGEDAADVERLQVAERRARTRDPEGVAVADAEIAAAAADHAELVEVATDPCQLTQRLLGNGHARRIGPR